MITRFFITLLLLLSLQGCSDPLYTNIDSNRLKTLMAEGVPLYDIRRVDEWRKLGVIGLPLKPGQIVESTG